MRRKKSEDSPGRAYSLMGNIDLFKQSCIRGNYTAIEIDIKEIYMGHENVTQFKLRPKGLERCFLKN